MKERDRRRRLVEPQTSHFEYIELPEGQWYRRGPPCPTCEDQGFQGVILQPPGPGWKDSEEACVVCTTVMDISQHGPKETGKARVLYPPDEDTLEENPYLNPLRPSKDVKDAQEALAIAGLNEVGNGRRLAIRFGEQLRFTQAGGWLVYDGRRWARDSLGTAVRMSKATLEECLQLAEDLPFWSRLETSRDHPGLTRTAFEKHIASSFTRGKIESLLFLASSEPQIAARAEDFDQEGWLLNCKNGVVNLIDGTLRPADPELNITQLVPHEYDPKATCPRWEQFLDEITCGDNDLRDYLHRAIGYTLTGETSEEKLFFMYGGGANGKSKFISALRHVFGDYGTSLSFEALLKSRNTTPEQGFAHLPGKRFATAAEGGDGRAWNQEAMKAITGRDVLRAKHLYHDQFEFRPICKLWLASNGQPRVEDYGEAMWRRLAIIPFLAHFEGAKMDEDLEQKLEAEAVGILAWAVRGSMRWYRERLRVVPQIMKDALAEYKDDNDIIGRWIAECCILDPNATCTAKSLYASFRDFAKANNEREMTQTAFGGSLSKWKNGRLKRSRTNTGIQWRGIMTKTQLETEEALSKSTLGHYERPSPPFD